MKTEKLKMLLDELNKYKIGDKIKIQPQSHWLITEATLEFGQLDAVVGIANGGQWQKCPKCDGQGIVSKPPWIAGDQNTWTDTQTSHTCNLCNGQMVIKQ